MMQWLRRARQTRTPVHSQADREREQSDGLILSLRALYGIQLALQLLLWLSLLGYDQNGQAVWQAAALQALPLAALWLLWKNADGSLPGARYLALCLWPCLLLDGYLLLYSSAGLLRSMIPTFPPFANVAMVTIFPLVTVVLGRENGLAYGAYALRVLLGLLFLLSTVLLMADMRVENFWPLLGQGFAHTAETSLTGAGAAWGVALLALAPGKKPGDGRFGPKYGFFVCLCFVCCLAWALLLTAIRPWGVAYGGLSMGQKLTALAQYSRSILICEAGSLFWMLLFPFALAGTAQAGGRLVSGAFPRLPALLGAALTLLPGAATVFASPEEMLGVIKAILPYRFVLAAAAGIWMTLKRRTAR